MTTIRETIISHHGKYNNASSERAAHLAGTLAETLKNGDYIVRPHPRPVFFIRTDEWKPDINISSFDFADNYSLMLSTGTQIELDPELVKKNIQNSDLCRVVLLSQKGFSSFKLNLQ